MLSVYGLTFYFINCSLEKNIAAEAESGYDWDRKYSFLQRISILVVKLTSNLSH